MKKKYTAPAMEIEKYEAEDICATSAVGKCAHAHLLDSGTTQHFSWVDESSTDLSTNN